jgi:uncharacterized membrane protein YtjA (UPF0391 family)
MKTFPEAEGIRGLALQGPAMSSAPGERRCQMLSWAITFLIIAIIAAVLGFAGVAGTAAWIARVLFVVFLILFVVSLIAGRGRPAA